MAFVEWVRNRYGTFPEDGFEDDELYPAFFNAGEVIKANIGCNGSQELVS